MATLFTFRNLNFIDFTALMKHYMQIGINEEAVVSIDQLDEVTRNQVRQLEEEIVISPGKEHKVTVTFEESKLMFVWSSRTNHAELIRMDRGEKVYMKSNTLPVINVR